MAKNAFSFFCGIFLIAVVVYLGFKAKNNQSFIIWFGLAAAFLVQPSFDLIRYPFTASKRQILERFSQVTEVEKLIRQAEEFAEKKRLLEQELSNVEEIVRREVRKQTLATRRESIEQDIARFQKDLEELDAEFSELETSAEAGSVTEEVQRILSRLGERKGEDKGLPLDPD